MYYSNRYELTKNTLVECFSIIQSFIVIKTKPCFQLTNIFCTLFAVCVKSGFSHCSAPEWYYYNRMQVITYITVYYTTDEFGCTHVFSLPEISKYYLYKNMLNFNALL